LDLKMAAILSGELTKQRYLLAFTVSVAPFERSAPGARTVIVTDVVVLLGGISLVGTATLRMSENREP
jgi:hypothetical protein